MKKLALLFAFTTVAGCASTTSNTTSADSSRYYIKDGSYETVYEWNRGYCTFVNTSIRVYFITGKEEKVRSEPVDTDPKNCKGK